MTDHEGGTFVFADIAGYTALTEAHGDADAAELAGTFCREMSQAARYPIDLCTANIEAVMVKLLAEPQLVGAALIEGEVDDGPLRP